jgi:LuxR family maltose regulon positive regulatory protein
MPSDTISSPAHDLVWTKLAPPAPRAGLIARAELQALLRSALAGRLCLLDAPAGSGKTTLLAQWSAAAGGRVAWVSLDEGDNDPTRFWTYVVEALRTVEPGLGATARSALQGASADLRRSVLPSLLNDLRAIGSPLTLVLDDYHLVTEASCHRTLGYFIEHLPAGVHVLLSTRADPPLPLARMRARGELAELRVADLQFTGEEAAALLNDAMDLRLAGDDVERLAERTEGWAAGLYLAGLSLRGRQDPSALVAAFHGDNRHIADYLTAEVLASQPDTIRAFLLRTSVLERLSGPLCDALLETEGSAELLRGLERSNLFLVPLDDHRQWYRYHQLFRELLRLELAGREPALVPTLHRRAAAWHHRAGHVDEAVSHATAAGDFAEANALIAAHWLEYWRRGRRATVLRWLDGLPPEAITADPPVAFVAAWIGGFSGATKQEVERWLAAVEDVSWEGALPDGIASLAFGAALARADLMFDDVGRSVAAARRALELAGDQPSPFFWMAQAALGLTLYLAGRGAEARPRLEELVRRVAAADQPYAVVGAQALLSLLAGDAGDEPTATALATRAAASAEALGLTAEPLCGLVQLALGRALTRQGRLDEAEEQLEWAVELFQIDSMVVLRAHGLLLLASARRARGDVAAARELRERARELTGQLKDPGALATLLERGGRPPPGRGARPAGPLTEREHAVLRLLPTRLTTREIGAELYVSVSTVRTQVQAIYRKLGVSSRAEAVDRARELGLISPR